MMTTNKEQLTSDQELNGITALLFDALKHSDVRLSISKKAILFSQLTSYEAYYICNRALDGAHGEDKLELLRILKDSGLLSQLTPKKDCYICHQALDGPLERISLNYWVY